jgi:pilus assembly protein CpaB
MFRIVILVVALMAGGTAAWLALAMRPASVVSTVVHPAPQIPTQDVLVASTDLGLGQTLTKDSMRWQSWPESMLNAAYITRSARADALDNLAGSVLRSRVASGEPILKEKLVPLNSGFLSAMLPHGKRAVAIRISAENTAGGFILPNDRVDVIHTVDQQSEGHNEQVSRTILTNVPVLAIDQSIDEGSKDDKAKTKAAAIGKTATVELDPGQAEVVAAAEAKGRLSLALRSAADNDEVPTVSRQPNLAVRFIRAGRAETVKVQ